jgi:hypothetical protein
MNLHLRDRTGGPCGHLSRSRRRLAMVCAPVLLAGSFIMMSPGTALAACSFDASTVHTTGSVTHGYQRLFCVPSYDYTFTVSTSHGHGNKYAALYNSVNNNLNCDDLESGSVTATCQRSGYGIHHYSYHEAPLSCGSFYSDGHGISCHYMEELP